LYTYPSFDSQSTVSDFVHTLAVQLDHEPYEHILPLLTSVLPSHVYLVYAVTLCDDAFLFSHCVGEAIYPDNFGSEHT
jgi:hypothetical protein